MRARPIPVPYPRRAAMAGALLALLAAAVLGGCASSDDKPAGSPVAASSRPTTPMVRHVGLGWQRLPDAPLSPRTGALGVYVDGEVLFLGGSDTTIVGGAFVPPRLRDGAALDLATRAWHPIARAPWAPANASGHVVVGDKVILARNGKGSWLSYDTSDDTWSRIPAPPRWIPQPAMAVIGHRVYALDTYYDEVPGPGPVQVLDTDTWSTLPESPHRPALDQRELVATDSGLVVMGGDLHPRQAGKKTQPALAELWTGHRWKRYASRSAAGMQWYWTGKRVVSAYRVTRHDSERGGQHRFEAAAFDPATGKWSPLPWLPHHESGLLDAGWATPYGTKALSEGFLYDDRDGGSTAITRPARWRDGSAVLTDNALVVFGGSRPRSPHPQQLTRIRLTDHAWILPTSQASLARQLTISPARSRLSADELVEATALARREIARAGAKVYSATVTAGPGRVRQPNTGHTCTSGRLLRLKLIGAFPHTVTTGIDVAPGSPVPDFTVRAEVVDADAATGEACQVGVQTRQDGEPRPVRGATRLDLGVTPD